MLLQRILIASTILKSGRNDPVPFVCRVNIFEDAAHPCIGANVFVGRLCPTKGAKDIHNDPKASHITSKV